jgi:hypothetical protein
MTLPVEVAQLAAEGRRLFPCKPGEKVPLISEWQLQATSDPAKLATWANSPCNWALATGFKSDVVALDIDRKRPEANGFFWLERMMQEHGDDWTLTRTVVTPSNGRHLYYSWPDDGTVIRNSAGLLAPGADIRAEAGYVCIPPSQLPTGGYAFWTTATFPILPLPEWLLQLIRASWKPDAPAVTLTNGENRIREGQRNATLFSLAASMRKRRASAAAIEAALQTENRTSCNPPLGNDEVSRIAESALRYQPDATVEADVISDAGGILPWPLAALDGDYVTDLTHALTKGTPIPPQFVREEIVLFLAALADGNLDYPRHRGFPLRRFLALVSEYPGACKGESWLRVAQRTPEGGALLELLESSAVRVVNGSGVGSGQFLASKLEQFPSAILFWDELSQLFRVTQQAAQTLFSELTSLFEGHSIHSGSLTNGEHGTDDAHLSILMHATRGTFEKGFALRQATGDGFLSRVVIAHAAPVPPIAEWELRDLKAEREIVAKIQALIPVIHAEPKIEDEARTLVNDFVLQLETPGTADYDYGRRLGVLLKSDLLHRCIYSGADTITADMAERSLLWARHQLALRRSLWMPDVDGQVALMVARIVNRLRRGTATPRDLNRALSLYRTGEHETFIRALTALTRSGQIEVIGRNRAGNPVYRLVEENEL